MVKSLQVMTAGARHYGVRVLGPFTLHANGRVVETAGYQRRPWTLLRILAVSPEYRRSRDELIDLLWPDSTPAAGANNLRQLLFLLRKALGDSPPAVLTEGGWVFLNPAHHWEVDLPRFLELAERGSDDVEQLEAAAGLYSGPPLVDDQYEDWAAPVREATQRAWREIVKRLAELHRTEGDVEVAIRWAQRLVDDDPLDEEGSRLLMRLHAVHGERTEALRTYYRFERRLQDELGAEPDGVTKQLAQEIAQLADSITRRPRLLPPRVELPLQPTLFVGRKRELAEVVAELQREEIRLLTLLGPGGTGKTRLAVQAAHEAAEHFPDGVYFIPLAPITEPALVPSTFAGVLGIVERGGQPLLDVIAEEIGDETLLLVVDNCEHLPEVAEVIATLLRQCPSLAAMTTSRSPLQLAAEHLYDVPPLVLPPSDTLSLEELAEADAVQLFVGRAGAARYGFRFDDETGPAVVSVCRRLEGLPLAIELAASRVRLYPIDELSRRLERRLDELRDGPRDADPRQRTLRATIAWSYELLTGPQQIVLGRLSVFAGDADLDAAAAVCADLDVRLDDCVRALAQHSLVRLTDTSSVTRVGMLDTIREFGRERLEERGETHQAQLAHAHYYLQREVAANVVILDPDAPPGYAESCRQQVLRLDLPELRAALRCLIDGGDGDGAVQLLRSANQVWFNGALYDEIRTWAQEIWDQVHQLSRSSRAVVLDTLATAARFRGEDVQARAYWEQSLELLRSLGDDARLAETLACLVSADLEIDGVDAKLEALLDEALPAAERSGNDNIMAWVLQICGACYLARNEVDRAIETLQIAASRSRTQVRRGSLSNILHLLAMAHQARSEYEIADPILARSLEGARSNGMVWMEALALASLAANALLMGNIDRAAAFVNESLQTSRGGIEAVQEAQTWEVAALVLGATGRHRSATRLMGAVKRVLLTIRDGGRDSLWAEYPWEVALIEDCRHACLSVLGDEAFELAWQEGMAMTNVEATALALSDLT